ncbi:MAG: DUF4340 domain-containing protein [Clostridia bacterium]
MRHYTRALILSSIALVLFSGLLAILLLTDSKEPAQPAATVHEINSFSVTEISAVAVNNATGAYGFILGPEGYITVVPEQPTGEEEYSQDEMRAFVYLLSRLSASQVIDGGGAAADFGLDQPLARVSLILKDSSTLRFFLGSQSPVDDSYYFQKEGDPRVFLIGKTTAELMLRARTDYWNKELLPGINTESMELLQSISLASKEYSARNWTLEHRGNFTFQLVEPISLAIKTDNAFSMLILPLSTLQPARFLGLSEDLAPYGLDKPDYTLTVTHGDTSRVLLFSRDGQGGFHASRSGKPGIFSLPSDSLEFLNLGYRDIVGDYIYNGSMASVDTIEFSRPSAGISYRLTLLGEGAQLYGILDGQSIPYAKVTAALTPLYGIGIVGEAGRDKNSMDEIRRATGQRAHAIVNITKRDGSVDTITFHPMNDSLSYVQINGTVSFTTYTQSAQTIENALLELANSKN